MNYIVLVKQVPDISNIPKEAWDCSKGTLKRGLLDNVLNELDKQALAFSLKLKAMRGGKIIALTMGPPFAEEILRYALSIGVDEAVLLTDRKLAGADTTATAYPLGQAIRKIEKEIFSGNSNYLIISGMQSVDGDTAQVPPQVAEELGITHVAYATSFSFNNGHVEISRITRIGFEVVVPQNLPCLVTVMEWTKPLYPSFSKTRWANFQQIHKWNADDISADESRIGLAGSKTNVVKVFSPRETSKRNCIFEQDIQKLINMIKETYVNGAEAYEEVEKPKYQLPEGKKPDYQGEVWVYGEQEGGELNPASFELLGKTRELANVLGVKVGAILIGNDINGMSQKLIAYGADKVYVADHELLENFFPIPYVRVISSIITKYRPQMMLFSATPLGRELGPRVAYSLDSGLTADCTQLSIADFNNNGREHIGILEQTRPALGGNIIASIITQNSKVQMSTTRPGVMKALEPNPTRKGKIIRYVPTITKADLGTKIVSMELHPPISDIKEAKIIICGGRALKNKEGFDKYILPLADRMGKLLGQDAMVGASRPAVELGCIARGYQVGQTGQTVKPRLYVAIGVSGAVQHITGMHDSDIVVVINKDPNAQIFRVADFGLVGDFKEVVPKLIDAMKLHGRSSE